MLHIAYIQFSKEVGDFDDFPEGKVLMGKSFNLSPFVEFIPDPNNADVFTVKEKANPIDPKFFGSNISVLSVALGLNGEGKTAFLKAISLERWKHDFAFERIIAFQPTNQTFGENSGPILFHFRPKDLANNFPPKIIGPYESARVEQIQIGTDALPSSEFICLYYSIATRVWESPFMTYGNSYNTFHRQSPSKFDLTDAGLFEAFTYENKHHDGFELRFRELRQILFSARLDFISREMRNTLESKHGQPALEFSPNVHAKFSIDKLRNDLDSLQSITFIDSNGNFNIPENPIPFGSISINPKEITTLLKQNDWSTVFKQYSTLGLPDEDTYDISIVEKVIIGRALINTALNLSSYIAKLMTLRQFHDEIWILSSMLCEFISYITSPECTSIFYSHNSQINYHSVEEQIKSIFFKFQSTTEQSDYGLVYRHAKAILLSSQSLFLFLKTLSAIEGIQIDPSKKIISFPSTNESKTIRNIENLHQHYENSFALQSIVKFAWLGLSAGELARIELFSRIFYAKSIIDQRQRYPLDLGPGSSILICLDEADTFMHPEWQRTFLRDVLEFIEESFEGYHVQLVISTHSPFLLSDVPKENVIFLGDKKPPKDPTFGANIHQLLSQDMFMDDTMGAFASSKIQEAIGLLDEDAEWSAEKETKVKGIIRILGEPLIRQELERRLRYRMTQQRLKDLEEEVEKLKKKRPKKGGNN